MKITRLKDIENEESIIKKRYIESTIGQSAGWIMIITGIFKMPELLIAGMVVVLFFLIRYYIFLIIWELRKISVNTEKLIKLEERKDGRRTESVRRVSDMREVECNTEVENTEPIRVPSMQE